jgi:hypothetical protein
MPVPWRFYNKRKGDSHGTINARIVRLFSSLLPSHRVRRGSETGAHFSEFLIGSS